MKRSFLFISTICVFLVQSVPVMPMKQPLNQNDAPHVIAGYAGQPIIGAPQVSEPKADGTVDVTVEIENAKETVSKGTAKEVVSSGVYDLRLFRDGQLVGSSIPKGAINDYIKAAPAAVEKDRLAYEKDPTNSLLNTEEDKLWRAANDMTKVVKFDAAGKGTFTFKNIQLPRDGRKGVVEFSAYAFNSDRVKSDTARTEYRLPALPAPGKKKAFIISVGVNASNLDTWKLNYAVKDAQVTKKALAERLSKQYDVVPVELVTDFSTAEDPNAPKNAIKANIRTVLELLAGESTGAADRQTLTKAVGDATVKRLTRSAPEDAVIITFSSHGYADQTGNFYLLPSDIRTTGTDQKIPDVDSMISSDELSLWLRDLDAGEMVMIVDACYAEASVSGTGFKPAPMGSRGLGQLAYDKQMRILTATREKDSAVEVRSSEVKQGLLTYALVTEGLDKGLADFQPKPDGKIWLAEWLQFAVQEVPKLFEKIEKGEIKGVVNKGIPVGESSKKYLQTPVLFDLRKKKEQDIQLFK